MFPRTHSVVFGMLVPGTAFAQGDRVRTIERLEDELNTAFNACDAWKLVAAHATQLANP